MLEKVEIYMLQQGPMRQHLVGTLAWLQAL